MIKIIGSALMLIALTACGSGYAQTASQTKVYCLEEQEREGYDYMVVADMSVCDNAIDDVELFETDSTLNIGDVAYIESEGSHSKAKVKKKSEVKIPSNHPPYVPKAATPTKICKIGYLKPAPPAPKPVPAPAPAPVAPKPAPVVPKPVPAPTAPKATAPAPTIKPGC